MLLDLVCLGRIRSRSAHIYSLRTWAAEREDRKRSMATAAAFRGGLRAPTGRLRCGSSRCSLSAPHPAHQPHRRARHCLPLRLVVASSSAAAASPSPAGNSGSPQKPTEPPQAPQPPPPAVPELQVTGESLARLEPGHAACLRLNVAHGHVDLISELYLASAAASGPRRLPDLTYLSMPSHMRPFLAAAYHYVMFFALLGGGLVFLALLLYFTGNIDLQKAVYKVLRRLGKTGALRQLAGILGAMVFVRYGLEPLIKNIRVIMKAQGSWEKSSEFYILREVGAAAAFVLRCCLFVATSHCLMLACSCAVQWPKKRGSALRQALCPKAWQAAGALPAAVHFNVSESSTHLDPHSCRLLIAHPRSLPSLRSCTSRSSSCSWWLPSPPWLKTFCPS